MTKQKTNLTKQFDRIDVLLQSVGIDVESFLSFVEWALSEQLVGRLSKNGAIQEKDFFTKSNALKRFRNIIRDCTRREWYVHDLNLLYNAVKNKLEEHFREPVTIWRLFETFMDYATSVRKMWKRTSRC